MILQNAKLETTLFCKVIVVIRFVRNKCAVFLLKSDSYLIHNCGATVLQGFVRRKSTIFTCFIISNFYSLHGHVPEFGLQ